MSLRVVQWLQSRPSQSLPIPPHLVTTMPPPEGRLSGEGYKFPRLILRTGDPSFFLFHLSPLIRLQALTLASTTSIFYIVSLTLSNRLMVLQIITSCT